jgi:hypothetical protein
LVDKGTPFCIYQEISLDFSNRYNRKCTYIRRAHSAVRFSNTAIAVEKRHWAEASLPIKEGAQRTE